MLTNNNNNPSGFTKSLLISNQEPEEASLEKDQIAFINYDHKNNIEKFKPKSTNPLLFPETLFIPVEKKIEFDDLKFGSQNKNVNLGLRAVTSKQQYIDNVNHLKEHIKKGNIYEINYCITFEAMNADIDPFYIYQKLNAISSASYSAFAKLDEQYIISSSPELYLQKYHDKLSTKPIKGTAKRGNTVREDNAIKLELSNSLKERTENVMIVDVARNDLSRVAKKGSVKVEKLFDIETYQQVHQMVSTVSCDLRDSLTFDEILDSTFPMASMTGAPKIKAMQLIDEVETYNRGPYSGCLGYISKNGDFHLNVLIRSIFYDRKKKYLSFSVGSAITVMCNAEDEYNECLLKAKALFGVLGQ